MRQISLYNNRGKHYENRFLGVKDT